MAQSSAELEALKQAAIDTRIPEPVRARWSPRAFAQTAVSAADLKAVFEAAQWAASSYNEQPWRFFVGVQGDETYGKIFESLVDFNKLWAKSAPVLILSIARKAFSHSGDANKFGLYDTGAATATLSITAAALGLHTHSMAGFDPAKARTAFAIPEEFEVAAVTALGYLGDAETLEGGMRESETAERKRKPLSEIVFTGSFGTAASL